MPGHTGTKAFENDSFPGRETVPRRFSRHERARRGPGGKIKDPYDNYGYLCESFRGQEEKIRFFFLLGDLARYDRQVSWKNSGFRGWFEI